MVFHRRLDDGSQGHGRVEVGGQAGRLQPGDHLA